jgi:hypothetical protein
LTPRIRRLADYAPETAREMRLIAHAATQRNLSERGARREHELLGDFNPSTCNPCVRGHAKGALERATEVAGADVQKCREISDANLAGKVCVDVRCEPPRLPGRKAAARESSCSLASGVL